MKVEELSGKVVIPSNSKQKIKAELEALGVNGKNKQSLLFNYKFRIEKCKKYWREFEAAKRVHADDLTCFM